jgi:hypothetical protein
MLPELLLSFNPISNFPETVPGWVGVKVTLTVQLAPGASEAPQLFVATKAAEVVVICWIVNFVLAAFTTVTGRVLL